MEHTNVTTGVLICREVSLANGIIACVVNLVMSITGTLGNILVCVTILATTKFHSSCFLLVSSLAVSDLLVTAVVQPMLVYTLIGGLKGECYPGVVRAISLATGFSLAVSLQTLTWISFDRCLAAVCPFRHKIILSPDRGKVIIIKTWSVAVILCFMFGFKVLSKETANIIAMTGLFACYLIMIVSYGSILNSVRKQRRIIDENCKVNRTAGFVGAEKRLAKNSALIVGLFTLCWVPMAFVILTRPRVQQDYTWTPAITWTLTGGLASATMDSAIYFYSNKELRDSAKKVRRRLECC